jgi:tetratricopeptide (TPR) repeat protein
VELGLAQPRIRAASLDITVASLPAVYKRMGGCALIEEAFQLYDSEGHRPSSLCYQLALIFHDAFKLTGNIGCLDRAIQLYRELLSMQPKGHKHRYSSLYALGKALRAHSENTRRPEHLEETIQLQREALSLRAEGQYSWHLSCHTLSLSLHALYKYTRQYAHLEEAIRLREQALDLRPEDHPYRPQACTQLALVLLTQFRYTGEGHVLDRAIGLIRQGLAILPDDDPFLYASYRALGRSLVARFGQTGTHLVLKEAIENYKRALALTPKGHPSRYWSCMGLAQSLCMPFQATTKAMQPSPLVEAIELYRESLDLHSTAEGLKDRVYYSLAQSLSARFSETGVDAIGREALQFHQKALTLRPEGHRQRNMSCYALAKCLRGLFPEDRGSKAAEVLELLNEALRLGTRADPLCWRIRLGRAEVNLLSLNDHESAVADLCNVLSSPQHDIPELLTESLKLLALISLDVLSPTHLKDLLLTHNNALDLLFVSAGFALDRGSQLQRVADGANIGARAFAISRRMDDLPAGLAVLERARGMIWSQALHTRNSQLDGVPPDLQKKLQDALRATSSAQSGEWDTEDVESSLESEMFLSEQDVFHQRHTQLQQVISDIRGLPGLHDFMRGRPDVKLLTTASKSTVIVLVTDEIGCHAIVMRSPHEPTAIRLDLNARTLQKLTLEPSASSVRGTTTSPTEDHRLGLRAKPKQRSYFYAKLAKVWRIIVKPVIKHLQLGVRDSMFSVNK